MKTRSSEEIIVLLLCVICILGLLPFSIIRFERGDYLVAAVDAIGAIGTSVVLTYVYRTSSTRYAGGFLAALALSGMVVNVFVLGPRDLFFLYPVVIATFFLVPARAALAMSLTALFLVSFVLLQSLVLFDSLKLFLSLLGTILFAFVFATQRNRQRDQLMQLSLEDPLTGAGNRRALHKRLEQIIASHQRTKEPMSAILLDLDNFKHVNDQFGHITGDEVLRKVADTVLSRIRATDNLYRYGGDEFLILAMGSAEDTARKLAEDVRALIAKQLMNYSEIITVSIGVAEYRQGETGNEWLARADAAMYGAKDAGRNNVVVTKL